MKYKKRHFHHTEETKKRISEKVKKCRSERKKKLGYINSPEARKRMSETRKKNPNRYWLGKKRPEISEEKCYNWKGDNVGYRALHYWVKKWKGEPTFCEKCGKEKTSPKSIQWANVDHKYRRVLDDYISLCGKCHKEYDKK